MRRCAAIAAALLALGPLGYSRSNRLLEKTAVLGPVTQLNYGPEFELTGFLVGIDTLVAFPAQTGYVIAPNLKVGDTVKVAGFKSSTPTGLKRIEPLELANLSNGKSFTIPSQERTTVYACSGTVAQFNYGAEGQEVGFVLDSGVLARTPPSFSSVLRSLLRTGTPVAISGIGHKTVSGQTIVDVQAINGQPIRSMEPTANR